MDNSDEEAMEAFTRSAARAVVKWSDCLTATAHDRQPQGIYPRFGVFALGR
jgi:hypothetical protein